MYNPESLMSGTPIIRNMSRAYYNRRMNITTIHDYDALNNHIRSSESASLFTSNVLTSCFLDLNNS